MKKFVISVLSSLISIVLIGATTSPAAQAADLTVSCSVSGTFTVSGTNVSSSTSNCAGQVIIPASVKTIGSRAFESRAVTGVTFEQNSALESIGTWAFHSTALASIALPNGLKSIGWWAFAESNLTSISIPGTVQSMDDDMFRSSLMTSVVFQPRLTSTLSLGTLVFSESPNISVTFIGPLNLSWQPAAIPKTGFNWLGWSPGVAGAVVSFPLTIQDPGVTLYPRWAPIVTAQHPCSLSGTFTTVDNLLTASTSDCAGAVVIPANVTEIAAMAFSRRKLNSVVFEDNSQLKQIGRYAFEFSEITSLELPASLEYIEGTSFTYAKISTVTIPSSVWFIGNYVFYGSDIETVIFAPRTSANPYVGDWANNYKFRSVTFQGASSLVASPFVMEKNANDWLGWSATPGGPLVSYPVSAGASGDVTLYPKWSPRTYVATFDSTGGTPVAAGTIVGGQIQFPAPPTRTHYEFAGWSDSTSGSAITRWDYNSGATFYALWTPLPFEVTYDSKGGSYVAPGSYVTDGSIDSAPTSPTRVGYTFEGWSATAGGNPISFPYYPGVTSDITLFALWNPNTYAINFDSRLGSNVSAGSYKTAGVMLASPADPSRAGYTFVGWSQTIAGSTVFWPFAPSTLGDVTLYAIWNANTNAVTFDSQKGTAVAAGLFLTDSQIPSAPSAPTRAGYKFDGWSSTADGTLLNFPYSPNATSDITLFAKWTAVSHVVNFDSNGGSAAASGSFVTDGRVQSAPVAPTRAGYTFASWSATLGGSSLSFPYAPGVIADITLYANWSANTNAINFDSTGGSNVSAGSFQTDGQVPAAPNAPIRVGYTFIGWAASADGTVITFPYSPVATSDITLYAKWTRNPYKPELLSGAVISGTGLQSTNLNANPGTWDAFPAQSVTYQWYRCDKTVKAGLVALSKKSNCVLIAGAKKATYKVAVGDAEKFLAVMVQAKNTIGTTLTTARAFRAPALKAPTKIKLPVVAGAAVAKTYMTATVATWASNPVAKATIQWYRCDSATKANASPVPGSCASISGANKARYKLGEADKGKFVTVQITAVNTQGSAMVTAKSQHVAQEPTVAGAPTISGSEVVNKTLTANKGTWLAFPTAKTKIAWYRCANPTTEGAKKFSGSSRCVAIGGASKPRYKLTADDQGKYLSVLVTATNKMGTKTVTAKSTGQIG